MFSSGPLTEKRHPSSGAGVQRWAWEVGKDLGHKTDEEQLRLWECSELEKTRLSGRACIALQLQLPERRLQQHQSLHPSKKQQYKRKWPQILRDQV